MGNRSISPESDQIAMQNLTDNSIEWDFVTVTKLTVYSPDSAIIILLNVRQKFVVDNNSVILPSLQYYIVFDVIDTTGRCLSSRKIPVEKVVTVFRYLIPIHKILCHHPQDETQARSYPANQIPTCSGS